MYPNISLQDAVLIFTAGNNIKMKLSSEQGNRIEKYEKLGENNVRWRGIKGYLL